MKKKTKLLGAIFALCTSICMLVVGVMAATTVGLDVTSSVSFSATGVYVKVNGEIKSGASTASLTTATGTGDYKYIGYSYDAVDEEQETDSQATDYNDTPAGTSSNPTMTAWTIGEVSFDETNKVLQYSFKFTNYSEFSVNATIKNYNQAVDTTPALSSTFSAFGEDVDVVESVEGGVITIPALSGTLPGTATYTITLTLKNFSASISQTLALNFEFEKDVESPVLEMVKWNSVDNYYYLEMGEYNNQPMEWRLVLQRTNDDVVGISEAGFTGDVTELSGKSYYFLLNTQTDNNDLCSYENEYHYSGTGMGVLDFATKTNYSSSVQARDYASSNIRDYILGNKVYRGINLINEQINSTPTFELRAPEKGVTYDIIQALESNQSEPDDFLSKYKIENSPLYNLIDGRSLADLYLKMCDDNMESPSNIEYNSVVENGEGDNQAIPSSTVDKLWLLSAYEAYKIMNTESEDFVIRSWNNNWWLRSPNSYSRVYGSYLDGTCDVSYVNSSGTLYIYSNDNNLGSAPNYSYAVRPAFQINF